MKSVLEEKSILGGNVYLTTHLTGECIKTDGNVNLLHGVHGNFAKLFNCCIANDGSLVETSFNIKI